MIVKRPRSTYAVALEKPGRGILVVFVYVDQSLEHPGIAVQEYHPTRGWRVSGQHRYGCGHVVFADRLGKSQGRDNVAVEDYIASSVGVALGPTMRSLS